MVSSYTAVELNIATSENQSRSRQWASQNLVNLYPDKQAQGRTESALLPWPGEKLFSTGTSGTITRGLRAVADKLYALIDQTLVRIKDDGTQIELGRIPGRNIVAMADDGFNLIIRDSGSACYINGKFILADRGVSFIYNERDGISILNLPDILNDGEFLVSDFNAPTVYQPKNRGEANLAGDKILQAYVYQKKIIFAGETSTEFYYDSGDGNPPVSPIQQASTSLIGTASRFSMAETPSGVFMLGNDGIVYKIVNFAVQSITTSSIAKELRLADKTDAQGFTVQIDGQWFYILQLSNANMTLAYSELTGTWLRLSTGSKLGRHLMAGYAYVFGKHIIVNRNSSTAYEWDFETYTSNGSTIIRQLTTAPINGLMLQIPGKRLVMSRARFIMESGVGEIADQDPQMMVQASFDGGQTFSSEKWLSMKRAGESTSLVDWYDCFSFYDLVLRVRVSDPVFTGFHSIVIDIKPGGD